MATELVDDTNPRVQYQPGWIWDQGVAEVDATRHGASIAGIEAWLTFTGTGVRVIGTLGVSDTYGQPKTTYWVDGNEVGSYSAPHTGQTTYNVTFFTMENLSSGSHVVRINNTDGTHPNTFWLDYFLIDNGPVATTTSTSTTTAPSPTQPANVQETTTVNEVRPVTTVNTQPTVTVNVLATTTSTSSHTATSAPSSSQTTSPTVSSQSSLTNSSALSSTSASSTTGSSVAAIQYVTSVSGTETIVSTLSDATPVGAAQTSAAPNPTGTAGSDAASTSHSNVGLIAGAAVAGAAILAILAIVFLCLRRRRVSATQDANAPAMRYNSTNAAATLPVSSGSQSGHPPASPSEVASESVGDHSEFYSLSASSGSALLSPQGRSTSPTRAPPPSTSYHPSATSKKSYGTPSLGFSTEPSTRPESLYTPSTPHPPPSPAFSNASGATLMPSATIPPGAWHAPPDSHGRAHTLLRSLFSRSGSRTELPVASRDVDSGLRLYDDVVLPPPYTQD
ncbi:hypothetical protein TRAPUB_13164 [Trametes pubescens]|uniref:Uncharacterized protein n=1 Tax=Trametes pubescens TaxID=154538 RepID=A0A1M2VRU2_TRAPU|nr:hypothetical protein TRAPUB_13164 [Trametes pubescens]